MPTASRASLEPARPLTVLVVDNDPLIVEATSALLSGLGHRPLGAGNIAAAMELVGQADALLADYQLDGDEDGLTLIEQVRSVRPGFPVLLITAESGDAMHERAARMGMSILAKPVDPERIASFLAEASVLEVEPE